MHKFDKIQIVSAQNLDELKMHKSAWDDLLTQCSDASPMQSYAWIYNYCNYAEKKSLKWITLFAYEDSKLGSVYPLFLLNKKGFPGFYLQVFKSPFNNSHTVHTDGLVLKAV